MKRHLSMPFGAELVEGGTRFRLWAPRAEAVILTLDHGRELRMEPEEGGWFHLTTPQAKAGTRYRYLIDGLRVPDPVSRFQPKGVHLDSEVIDATSYDWTDTDWRGVPWEEIILYELHVGTFSAAGTFAGMIDRLDHIVDLGATAVEIMPVAAFPGDRNWGYDGATLFAPAASYGRPDDLKRLVEACHRRGLSVILDVVYNHFGPEGNYIGHYAPQFFTDRHHTPWGAGLNFDGKEGPDVRAFFVSNALYWLEEFHMDGLRLDAVHAILDDSDPHILEEIAANIRERITDRPIHLILENDANEASLLRREEGVSRIYTAQWNDDVHHALRVLANGDLGGYYEDYSDKPLEHLGRALAEGYAYQGEVSGHRNGESRGEASADVPLPAFISFIQNHDQVGNNAFGSRIAHYAKSESARLAVAAVILTPCTPLIFMGEEWATNAPFPFFCDFGPDLAESVREGRRREFGRFPEFRTEESLALIPDPCAVETRDSAILDWNEMDRPQHQFWYRYYRRLIQIRRTEIAPRLHGMRGHAGRYSTVAPTGLAVSWTLGDGSGLDFYTNWSSHPIAMDLGQGGRVLFSAAIEPAPGHLGPWSALLRLHPAKSPDSGKENAS